MSKTIAEIEDALIALVTTAFTSGGDFVLKAVDALPGEFDEESIARMYIEAPAVYVLYLGADPASYVGTYTGHWAFYAVTAHQGGPKQRRRGGPREIGAYEILQLLIPAIEDAIIEDEGRFTITGVRNLFTARLMKKGVAAYSVTASLPMSITAAVNPADLSDFVTYYSDLATAPPSATLPLPDNGQPINQIDDLSEET